MELSPIILFVYNRPAHTRRTLEALSANNLAAKSLLYIFSDGPKENASSSELINIEATRNVIKSKKWCGEVVINEKRKNRGLVDSIIAGISDVTEAHGRAIVLEDDIITQPGFLQFMNDALVLYADQERVMQIVGTCTRVTILQRAQVSFYRLCHAGDGRPGSAPGKIMCMTLTTISRTGIVKRK